MNVNLISYRFARALYDYSASVGEEDEVYGELELLQEQLNQSGFTDALDSPLVSFDGKLRLLNISCGNKASDSIQRFFGLVLSHRREYLLPEICHSFKKVYENEKGIMQVCLTTAIPLDEERSARILGKLEKSTGKKIELIRVVQPDIIGGYVLSTDEKRLDVSVRTKLINIRKKLTI